jgi:hypothetical protein
VRFELPILGVSDIVPASERQGRTTRYMVNMVAPDPATKQVRLSVRGGIEKFIATQVNGDSPVRAVRTATFQRKNVAYAAKASTSSAPLELTDASHSAQTASKTAVTMNATDRSGNLYSTDGNAVIEKRNATLTLQWKLTLPVVNDAAVVRALTIGSIPGFGDVGDVVFAGVSAGGRQADAKVWGYKQITEKDKDGKDVARTEQIFEIVPDAFTARVKIRNGLMYCAQNEPDKGRAYVRVYYGLATPQPEVGFEFEVPYPINDIDVRDSDGAMCTSHPQNTTRGKDPRAPYTAPRDLAREWRIEDHLVDYNKRIWSRYRAKDLATQLELVDGDPIEQWPDLGPSFRTLVADTSALTNLPTWVENGSGGQPSARFNDRVAGLNPRLLSDSNPAYQAQFDDMQRTSVPAFTGCKWALFIVLRPSPDDSNRRPVFHLDNTSPAVGGADADVSQLVCNGEPAFTRGAMTWWTQTAGVTGEGGNATASGGGRNMPMQGWVPMSGSPGACVVSIIMDGGANGGTDLAQHGTWRLNGRPIDRYIDAPFSSRERFNLGRSTLATFFDGDIAEIIVLRDYPTGVDHTGTGNAHGDPVSGNLANNATPPTQHYPRVVGTFGSAAVAYAAAANNRYNDNELERIEGMLAGDYGISHLLPCGTANVLTTSAAILAADTVTIGSVTYTFVAALTGALNEVLVGANVRATIYNLWSAINCVGEDGVLYSSGQVEHPSAVASHINIQGAANVAKLKIETKGLTVVGCSESTGGVRMAWTNNPDTAALATVTTNAETFMPGHYPHPFNINYGFPRPDVSSAVGSTLESKGKLLNSTEEILARWDPQGRIAWVLTSRLATVTPGGTLPATDQKFGGLGFACQWSLDGDAIYTVGSQYSTSPSGTSQEASVRRILDTPTAYDIVSTGAWSVGTMSMIGNAANTYMLYPSGIVKIDVDEHDNVYVPYDSPPVINGVMSLVCIGPDGVTKWHWRASSGGTNPAGACVSVDRKTVDYDGDPVTVAFAVYLGTRMGYATDSPTQPNIYRIEPVTATHAVGVPPTETRIVAFADGKLRTSYNGGAFTDPAGAGSVAADVFADQADNPDGFVSMATLRGHVFATDGVSMIDYDARKDKLSVMEAEAGELKKRARGVVAWRDRLVWFRFADTPHEYLMSASGNSYDYDIAREPFDSTMAVLGTKSPRGTGQAPDIINDIVPYSDDTAIFLCATSIYRLDGDPGDAGSRFFLLSDSTGGAFGGAWCKDEAGILYFMGTRGCVYAYLPNGGMRPLSEDAIPERLRDIDFNATRVMLLWDSEYQGVRVMLTPLDAADVAQAQEHYFWSRRTKGWYPFTIASDDMQPTATFVGDGELASTRRAVMGCADGYLRSFSVNAEDDDGVAISWAADVGPLQGPDGPFETHFKDLRAVLARDLEGCGFALYALTSPDDENPPVETGELVPGRNPTLPVQAVGSHVKLRLSGEGRCAVEMLEMNAYLAGVRT